MRVVFAPPSRSHRDGPLSHLLQSISGERRAQKRGRLLLLRRKVCGTRGGPRTRQYTAGRKSPADAKVKNRPRRSVNVGAASAAAVAGGREGRLAGQRQRPAPRRPRPMDRKAARHGPRMDRRPRTGQ
jgi:hypothetical protein